VWEEAVEEKERWRRKVSDCLDRGLRQKHVSRRSTQQVHVTATGTEMTTANGTPSFFASDAEVAASPIPDGSAVGIGRGGGLVIVGGEGLRNEPLEGGSADEPTGASDDEVDSRGSVKEMRGCLVQ